MKQVEQTPLHNGRNYGRTKLGHEVEVSIGFGQTDQRNQKRVLTNFNISD